MKLNQLIAIVTGEKTKTQKEITGLYKKSQKGDLMTGLTRHYTPKDEEGDRLPSEQKLVQFTSGEAMDQARDILGTFWDLIYQQDCANTQATGDISIDGELQISAVPVTYLIFLEKQINDLQSLIEHLPVLDPSEQWTYSNTHGCMCTGVIETVKTKKIMRNHVKAEATEHHPAQVEVYTEDVVVGHWSLTKLSAALTAERKKQLLDRVNKLRNAIKAAREQANGIDVERKGIADFLFDYVYG